MNEIERFNNDNFNSLITFINQTIPVLDKKQLKEVFNSIKNLSSDYKFIERNEIYKNQGENITKEMKEWLYKDYYLKTTLWQLKRDLILEYYNNRCFDCKGMPKDIHHLSYKNIYKEEFEDLIPLCRHCHNLRHGKDIAEFFCVDCGTDFESNEENPSCPYFGCDGFSNICLPTNTSPEHDEKIRKEIEGKINNYE